MLELYSPQKAEEIIRNHADEIEAICGGYGLPSSCLKAILYQEIIQIDALDLAADGFVRFFWWRYRLRKRLHSQSPEPLLRKGPFGKRDSSTGYGQIFAYVAINAANFAVDRGIASYEVLGLSADHRLDGKNPEDLSMMWYTLVRNRSMNLTLSALNLISAGEEMNGHTEFERYTAEELQHMFTRYNANTKRITPYGERVYENYLRYLNE